MFVFVKNMSTCPWVGHIKQIFKEERKIKVEWMCDVSDIEQPKHHHHSRCLNEMYLTTLHDKIDLDTVEDIADVLFHHDGHDAEQLCWRQRYNHKTGQFTPKRMLPPNIEGQWMLPSNIEGQWMLPSNIEGQRMLPPNIEGQKRPGSAAECVENIMSPSVPPTFWGRSRRSSNRASSFRSNSKITTVPKSQHRTSASDVYEPGKFICPFARYGCEITSHYAEHWKRHVAVQHLQLGFYRCDIQNCMGFGSDFRRSDAFTDHRRRRHGEALALPKAIRHDIEARCWIRTRELPERSTCGFCGKRFVGAHCWNNRMLHVQRHFVQGESRLNEEREDVDLTRWALREGIVRRGGDGSLRLV